MQPPRPPSLPARLIGDERLAREVGRGQDSALAALFERYHQQLYRYCRSLTRNDQDAQDALQSTFANALVALRAGNRNAPLRPWLFRIAHNESISLVRGRRSTVEVDAELEASGGVHESYEQRERLASLVSDLQELPERQRSALVLREMSGLSHEEIGQVLQISSAAAKQTILEARRSLLEFSEGRAMGCDEIQRIISDADGRSLRSRRVRAHLRSCKGCAAFAGAIGERRRDMLALFPLLAPVGAAGVLARLTGGGSGHGGGAVGMAAGAAKGVAATASMKVAAVAGVAVLATATVGTVAVLHHRAAGPRPRRAPASAVGGAASSGRSTSAAGTSAYDLLHTSGAAASRRAAGRSSLAGTNRAHRTSIGGAQGARTAAHAHGMTHARGKTHAHGAGHARGAGHAHGAGGHPVAGAGGSGSSHGRAGSGSRAHAHGAGSGAGVQRVAISSATGASTAVSSTAAGSMAAGSTTGSPAAVATAHGSNTGGTQRGAGSDAARGSTGRRSRPGGGARGAGRSSKGTATVSTGRPATMESGQGSSNASSATHGSGKGSAAAVKS